MALAECEPKWLPRRLEIGASSDCLTAKYYAERTVDTARRYWDQTAAPKTSAHEKAFDLFDGGKLSEKALLIAVGAERSGFELAEDLRLRTLTSFEDGSLSEDAMIKLLS